MSPCLSGAGVIKFICLSDDIHCINPFGITFRTLLRASHGYFFSDCRGNWSQIHMSKV